MRSTYEILKRPVLTEKMSKLQEAKRQFAFEVNRKSSKIEIKRAVQEKFDVTVENINVIVVKGKSKRLNTRRGLTRGKRSDWKKAIVTLREGDSIDFLESA